VRSGGPEQALVIVSEGTAARIWPGEDAVGKRIREPWSNRTDTDAESTTLADVVGVVADTRTSMNGAPPMVVYMPYWVKPQSGASLAIRTAQDPTGAVGAVRTAIWSIDSDLPIPEMKTMRRTLYDSVSQRRFQTTLLAGFGLAALVLAV